jgi:GxxExxY protein
MMRRFFAVWPFFFMHSENDPAYWTDTIIGAAIEVHRVLGPCLSEATYDEALRIELSLRDIPYERQVCFPVVYKNHRLRNSYRIDLIVAKVVVVEIKTV